MGKLMILTCRLYTSIKEATYRDLFLKFSPAVACCIFPYLLYTASKEGDIPSGLVSMIDILIIAGPVVGLFGICIGLIRIYFSYTEKVN